jgi:hypothetical protein
MLQATSEDAMREQSVAIGGGKVDWLTIVIEKVWPGGDGLDTLVSEIVVDEL